MFVIIVFICVKGVIWSHSGVYTLHAVLCRIKMFEMTIKDYSKSTLLIRFNISYATPG